MAAVVGNPSAVQIGPGALWVAPIGTAEPTSASAAYDPAFVSVGYTDEGNEFSYEASVEAIEVAEEQDPVRFVPNGRNISVAFAMAEITKRSLMLAMNQGVNANNTTAFEPPTPGTEVRVIIGFDAEDGARWIFRQCFQSDAVSIERKKSPDKAVIPVSFRLEKPTGLAPFKIFPAASGLI